MRIFHKITRVMLAAVLLFSFLALPAQAVEIIVSGTCGENLTWELDSNYKLTISGTGAMDDYSSDNPMWGSYRTSITAVELGSGVTSISEGAFASCDSLTSVTLPDSLISIGETAFSSCNSLTSITIPNSVTNVGIAVFSYCSSLTSVTISNRLTSLSGGMFAYCTSLPSITIPDSVISIDQTALFGCSSLNGIWTSENNPNYCSDERGVLFNKEKTELVRAPGGLSGSYIIPNGVTNISDEAFAVCSNLANISIPNSVKNIGEKAFSSCFSLTSIMIPDSVTSIENNAFLFCTGLTDVTIPNSVTIISFEVFSHCYNLTSVTIPDSVTSIGDRVFMNCRSLTDITIPDSVASIGEQAFYGCKSLTAMTIPEGVTSIDSEAFCSCTNLDSVVLPSSLDSIGSHAFYKCGSLTAVYFMGTRAQRNALTVDKNNDDLLNATWHYAQENLYDVAPYRSDRHSTAPVKEGYVFAGWFTDAAFTTPLGESVRTGTAYAKFVDEDVLSVKWQISNGTNAESAKTDIRLLTSVDTLNYKLVGFTVEAAGKPVKELTTKTVYRTIYGYVSGNNESYLPTIFSSESNFFMAHTLSGLPQSDFDTDIKVTPQWVTLDGTIVTGTPLTFKISDDAAFNG